MLTCFSYSFNFITTDSFICDSFISFGTIWEENLQPLVEQKVDRQTDIKLYLRGTAVCIIWTSKLWVDRNEKNMFTATLMCCECDLKWPWHGSCDAEKRTAFSRINLCFCDCTSFSSAFLFYRTSLLYWLTFEYNPFALILYFVCLHEAKGIQIQWHPIRWGRTANAVHIVSIYPQAKTHKCKYFQNYVLFNLVPICLWSGSSWKTFSRVC